LTGIHKHEQALTDMSPKEVAQVVNIAQRSQWLSYSSAFITECW
jgi:hypothetical protein